MDTLDTKVRNFFATSRTRTYKKGQILIFAGDDPKYVFYILKGMVRMYDVSYRGEEIVTNVFKPGAFFPMSWAINKTPNYYFFQAADDVEVALADPEETVAFVKNNADIMFDLLSRVYRGTDGMMLRMVQLMGGSARERLALEILLACRRFGIQTEENSYQLQMTETELASRAGLTRETVSRELKKLARDDILQIKQGDLRVYKIEKLQAILGKPL